MASAVRAVALAALAERGRINKDDIDRYMRHMPEMDLFGRSHLLAAALRVGAPAGSSRSIMDTILASASQSGGRLQLNETLDDGYKYLLATPLRSYCAALSSLLTSAEDAALGGSIRDIPFKLVRSITQARGNRDHWENTQENVFCLQALSDYSRHYEAAAPAYKASVSLDGQELGSAEFRQPTDDPVELKRSLNQGDAGKAGRLTITREGEGRLYYSTRLAYDVKAGKALRVNAGIEVRREYSIERNGEFELLGNPMEIRRGDIVRVDLFVSVPTARHFVAVNDPVPGGLEPINIDLATASVTDVERGEFKAAAGSWWFSFSDWRYYGRYFYSFYHKELRHDSARFYADYLPAGNYHLSYTAQAIAPGAFHVMPVRAEEMYDPDVYGHGLPATLKVTAGGSRP